MRVTSWVTVEEQVQRALALEMISNVFPPIDAKSQQILEQDANRVVTSLRNLPADFEQSALEDVLANARLKNNYRETLARTLAHMLTVDYASSSHLAAV